MVVPHVSSTVFPLPSNATIDAPAVLSAKIGVLLAAGVGTPKTFAIELRIWPGMMTWLLEFSMARTLAPGARDWRVWRVGKEVRMGLLADVADHFGLGDPARKKTVRPALEAVVGTLLRSIRRAIELRGHVDERVLEQIRAATIHALERADQLEDRACKSPVKRCEKDQRDERAHFVAVVDESVITQGMGGVFPWSENRVTLSALS
jgi:hypothetical protein